MADKSLAEGVPLSKTSADLDREDVLALMLGWGLHLQHLQRTFDQILLANEEEAMKGRPTVLF